MRLCVPTVKVADNRNQRGIRRPNSKHRSGLPPGRHDVRAQLVVNPVVGAFVEQMKVLIGQQAGIAG